jgi:hypothetical protein
MAQVTGAVAQSIFKLEVSAAGVSWTDVSGAATSLTLSGGDVVVGEQMTADGEEAIVVTSNKMAPMDLTFRVVYTEGSSDAFKVMWDLYQGTDKRVYVRWSPRGGAATQKRYVTAVAGAAAPAVITGCKLPDHDASSGDPALAEFSVKTAGILEETISQ